MALDVRGLCAGYGGSQALFGIDLSVEPGQVLVLVGRNGAGKSTTMKAIMGLVPPLAGEVLLEGKNLSGLEPFEIARLGVGYVPEERRIFPELSVAENLEVGRKTGASHRAPWSPERIFALFPELKKRKDFPGARLSGGEQQMLAVGRTLAGNPSVLLLDEPAEGLAPKVVALMGEAILELKRSGLAILLAEQNFRLAERVGDRACLLAQGQVRARGPVREMRDNLAS